MELGNGVNQDINDQTKLCNHDKDQPTNLLDKFSPEKNCKETQNSNLSQNSLQQPQFQPDLNLRLSLGSIYGENYIENPLTRRSSVAGIVTLTNSEVERSFLSLSRARSLPTVVAEQEQGLITRQELQTVRRIEAKNRLIEKQRSFKEARQKEKFPVLKPKPKPKPNPALPSEVAAWAAASAANSPALCRAIHKIKAQGLSRGKGGVEGSAPPDEPSRSQAVVEGSATPIAPSRMQAEVEDSAAPNAPSSFKVPPVVKNAETVVTSATTSNGICVKSADTKPTNPYKKARTYYGNFEDIGMDVMRQMPTVSTTGEGPNGRRIEGFLYTYTRGHVCIVCVCHGSFLSPAEFVKHAGGNDVPNPMKHITVYSTFA